MVNKRQPKKREWRKAKIDDVEDALEDERLVQKLKRQAGPNNKKKKDAKTPEQEEPEEEGDDDLFTVDTAGSGEGLSKKTRRELAREKLFPAKEANIGLSASEAMKVAKAERKLEHARKMPNKSKPAPFDLWSTPAVTPASEILPAAKAEFSQLRGRKLVATKMPKTLHQKEGWAPAVLPAHEGQSMNPEANAYEELTFTAAATEMKREREEAELNRKIRPMTHELREMFDPDELNGLSEEAKVAKYRSMICKPRDDDGNADDDGQVTSGRGRRKSQAQKNKRQKQKIIDEEERQLRDQRKLEKSVGEVGAILKDMKRQDTLSKERKAQRGSILAEKRKLEETKGVVPKRRRLGRSKFMEEALVVPDAAAASQGLRAMRLKGSAIKDRLSSIVRRGMVTATPEASKTEMIRMGKKNGRLKRSKKFISPLLRNTIG